MRTLESLSWAEIGAALGGRAIGEATRRAHGASIDTRTIEAGDIFFALKGERTDGHDHVSIAIEKGASCVVIKDEARAPEGALAFVVQDPEHALFEMARLVRSRSTAAFVAITGSAGKTTAKDFTAELLRAKGPVLATCGNLNNHLGVPLTLARLETEHWAAVIECGMSHSGELSRLAQLLRPRVAVITNAAPAHLEFFSSVNEIAAAKAEIFETVGPSDTAVAPADDQYLVTRARASQGSVCLFGLGPESSMKAMDVSMSLEGSDFELRSPAARTKISLPAPGPHAIANFLVAATVADALGISLEAIASRARRLSPGENRGTVKRLSDDILLIDDSYNSNPKALLAAIETLGLARDRRRVACLGDMLELGASAAQLHREAGAVIAPKVDLLLGVGPLGGEIVAGALTLPSEAKQAFANSVDLAERIGALVKSHDAVLVKGSRSVRMERVIEALMTIHPRVAA